MITGEPVTVPDMPPRKDPEGVTADPKWVKYAEDSLVGYGMNMTETMGNRTAVKEFRRGKPSQAIKAWKAAMRAQIPLPPPFTSIVDDLDHRSIRIMREARKGFGDDLAFKEHLDAIAREGKNSSLVRALSRADELEKKLGSEEDHGQEEESAATVLLSDGTEEGHGKTSEADPSGSLDRGRGKTPRLK